MSWWRMSTSMKMMINCIDTWTIAWDDPSAVSRTPGRPSAGRVGEVDDQYSRRRAGSGNWCGVRFSVAGFCCPYRYTIVYIFRILWRVDMLKAKVLDSICHTKIVACLQDIQFATKYPLKGPDQFSNQECCKVPGKDGWTFLSSQAQSSHCNVPPDLSKPQVHERCNAPHGPRVCEVATWDQCWPFRYQGYSCNMIMMTYTQCVNQVCPKMWYHKPEWGCWWSYPFLENGQAKIEIDVKEVYERNIGNTENGHQAWGLGHVGWGGWHPKCLLMNWSMAS